MKKVVIVNLDYILKYLLVRPDKFNITIIKYYLTNISKANDAVKILKYLSLQGYNNCDKIIERLCYLYSLCLPDSNYMARLSLLYQPLIGTNSESEFAVLTLWAAANQAIIESENDKDELIKIQLIVCNNLEVAVKILLKYCI